MTRRDYPQYDSENLGKTLDELGNMKHKALMEYYALKEENEILKEKLSQLRQEYKENTKGDKIQSDIKLIEGRKIKKVEILRAEFGRTYDNYLAVVCEDGTRIIVTGGTSPYNPLVELKEMEKSEFFTQEEVQRKRDFSIARERQKEEEYRKRKEEELRRLQKELEK